MTYNHDDYVKLHHNVPLPEIDTKPFLNQFMRSMPLLSAPPLGLLPRRLHDEARGKDIAEAIRRRLDAETQHEIPVEWVEEYNEIVSRQKARRKE